MVATMDCQASASGGGQPGCRRIGLSRASGKASKAGTVTMKLTLTKGEAAFLAKHHGRKLRARINLNDTPKGSKLRTSVTVLIGSGIES